MDSKQKNSLIGSLIFFFDGLTGIIYYLFFYYSFPLIIVSIIFTIPGLVFLILTLARKLPPFSLDLVLAEGPIAELLSLLFSYILAIMGVCGFLFDPIWRPIFFLIMVYGVSGAGFCTYLYITLHK